MRLVSVRVQGFRCFRDEISAEFDRFTTILGRNDAGKSSLLEALNIFFEQAAMEQADLCVDSQGDEIVVACEFDELPESLIIDADFPTTLVDEYLVNERGRLEVVKRYDCGLKTPKASVFVRALHPSEEGVNDLHQLAIAALRARAQERLPELPRAVRQTVSTELRRAIWRGAGQELQLATREIPVSDESTKKIWEQLKRALPTFALFKSDRPSTDQDAEAQDPIKLAVAEALKAQEDVLEQIRQHVEDQVLEVANRTLEKLAEIDSTLAHELRPTVQRPNWANAFKIGLTDGNAIPVNKRGSGVRRLILLNFFRAQAERAGSASGSAVIYAIEEPETSQHPTYQRLLVKAFLELSEAPGRQVIITTHNPALARDLPIKSLRLLAATAGAGRDMHGGTNEVYERAARELGVLPDNGVKVFVGLEGTNDVQFFRVISGVLASTEADIPNLATAENDGRLIFIPLNGSNLLSWVNRFRNLNRPEFHLFDRDRPLPHPPKYEDAAGLVNAREGCWAGHTACRELENYLHPDAIRQHWNAMAYADHDPFEDVPTRLAQLRVAASGADWAALSDKGRAEAVAGMKRTLSTKVVARMNAAQLTAMDPEDVIRGFLRRIGEVLNA